MDMNTFGMSTEKGFLSNVVNNNVLPCRIYASSVATLYGATAVKVVDTSEKELIVDKAGPTDKIFGFLTFNSKINKYIAGDRANVAFENSVMNMEAGAAILAGAELEQVATGDKVITNAGTNTKVAIALRKATTDGDIIPVLIKAGGITQNIALADLPAIAFTDLSDTPATYNGSANDTVKVNGTNDGLVFVTV